MLQGKRLVYTKKDIEEVVQYARARGIRVIPEIDMVRSLKSHVEGKEERINFASSHPTPSFSLPTPDPGV